MSKQFVELPISAADGQFVARYSAKGLAELEFPPSNGRRRGDKSQISSLAKSVRDSSRRLLQVPDEIHNWHRATETALEEILAGRAPKNLPPLDLSGGTEFQQAVWRELRKISRGKTKSYGEIAQAIGKDRAVRAVGGACGANPVPVLVPCHRVLAAHGKIGGFGGGLDWKRKLLAREGVKF
ncbi:MAG TPA: methylated-DNA--[protein]-cysteine S-methyltransferase [Candidatus Sulfopaludibacter sp.]|nr:methylated-DNA--[protein]-cysteine S-methyltransferase [Candidatus Sulfopaludibacter sp.]